MTNTVFKIAKEVVERVTAINDITNKSRKDHIVKARVIYIKICVDYIGYHPSEIAKSIEMTHATVIHHYNSFDSHYRQSEFFRRNYKAANDALLANMDDRVIEVENKYSQINSLIEGIEHLTEDQFSILKDKITSYINLCTYHTKKQ